MTIAKVLVSSQTDAVLASRETQFEVREGQPATLSATALATTEEVDITYSGDNGTTFTTAFNDSDTALVLTATKAQLLILGVGVYRVAKDSTASACAVNVTPFFASP